METSQNINALLSAGNVLVNDLHAVIDKITAIKKASLKQLQIVADFDLTLTAYRNDDGEETGSSFGVLENYCGHSADFREKLVKLRQHYAPVDADPTIAKDEKVRLIGLSSFPFFFSLWQMSPLF